MQLVIDAVCVLLLPLDKQSRSDQTHSPPLQHIKVQLSRSLLQLTINDWPQFGLFIFFGWYLLVVIRVFTQPQRER